LLIRSRLGMGTRSRSICLGFCIEGEGVKRKAEEKN
jgi:hypothetical protein